MKKINFNSYSVLRALRMPVAEGNPPIVIAAGKLSDVIKLALKVSNVDYYGPKIKHGGGELDEKNMRKIYHRTDFPK